MRYAEILLEFDLNKTIQSYGDKLLARVKKDVSSTAVQLLVYARSNNPEESVKKAIEKFIEHDPTSKKVYVLWMIDLYLNNGIRFLEDLSRTQLALKDYTDLKFKNKLKPEHKNIKNIKSLNELEQIIESYKETPIEPQSERQREKELEQKFFKDGEAILFHNDPQVKIVIPKTERASCFFGRNTKWCTAATRTTNLFDTYQGNIYIVLLKKENKRYQFHFESNQYMDEEDDIMSPEDWSMIRNKYPQILEKFDSLARQRGFIPLINKPTDDEILESVIEDPYSIQYVDNISEELQIKIANKAPVAFELIRNPEKTSPAALKIAISKWATPGLLKHHNYEFTPENQFLVVENNPLHIKYLINPSIQVKQLAVEKMPRALIGISPWTFDLLKRAVDSAITKFDIAFVDYLYRENKMFFKDSLKNLTPDLKEKIKEYIRSLDIFGFEYD